MRRIYIIIIDERSLDGILIDRIRVCSEDNNFRFWNNHWLLASNHSAEEIYNILAADAYSNVSIYVQEINLNMGSFWGRMNKALWDWVKSNMPSNNLP